MYGEKKIPHPDEIFFWSMLAQYAPSTIADDYHVQAMLWRDLDLSSVIFW